jgi:hypothetical protein
MKMEFIGGAAALALFWISTAGAAQPSKTVIKIPPHPWNAYYIQAIKQATSNHAPSTLRFPQIYLYNPQGKPVAFVQNPQRLKKVLEKIPVYAPRVNVAKHPLNLATQLRLLRESGAGRLATPPSGKWVVLFYGLADSSAAKKLAQVLEAAPQDTVEKLYIIRVNFQLKSIPPDGNNPKT